MPGGWARGLALAAALAAGPALPAAAQDAKPAPGGGPPNDPKAPLVTRVNQAIDSGVAWLLKQPAVSGTFGDLSGRGGNYAGGKDGYVFGSGLTSLSLYALLKCEVPPDHPVIQKGFEWLRRAHEVPMSSYEISTLILALEARSNPHKKENQREREGRAREGRKAAPVKLPAADAAWMRKLVAQLMRRRQGRAGWRYNLANPPDKGPLVSCPPADVDMSSTQLAVLALAAVERCGLRQPDDLYVSLLDWTLGQQEKAGPPSPRDDPGPRPAGEPAPPDDACRGWSYIPTSKARDDSEPTGSMTACGLANLATCTSILEGRGRLAAGTKEAAERSWRDGVAWLKSRWKVGEAQGYTAEYFLYCVERVGDIRGVHLLGGHDWYAEGATYFVDRQRGDGAWASAAGHEPRDGLGTCFALLFLSRATPTVTTGE